MEDNNSWLKKAIAQGFMMLAPLNLKGRPASADLTAVAELWLGILSGRSWQPEQDGIRIQAAFRAIAASSSEWPNPADLIKHLPPPEIRMVPKLEKKHRPTEYGKAQAAKLKQTLSLLESSPCMNRDWIHGPRHRSVDECKRINAERQKGKGNE